MATSPPASPPIDLGRLLFSFRGRISRGPYWLGHILLLGFAVLAFLGGPMLEEALDIELSACIPFLVVAFVVIHAALIVKRLHDRNRPAWLLIFFLLPELGGSYLLDLLAAAPFHFDLILYAVITFISVWLGIECGWLRGTQGPNRYGPDPT